ncbi:MAG: hypothetical protein RIS47_2268, partial [Bacteroidota bacterium]
MIESIHIENFKCLEKLTIHSLSRVNLIIGKNNTGKSTLLEAIALYASQADLKEIARILKDRGVIFTQTSASKSITEYNIENFSSLFTNRHVGFQPPDRILIGTHVNTLFGKEITLESSVSLRFVKYNTEIDEVPNKTNKNIEQLDNEIFIRNYGFGIEIRNGLMPRILPLDDERLYSRPIFRNTDTVTNFQFVRTYDQAKEVNGNLWDKITLTEKEAYVIQALRIIEPRIERIAFVNDGDRFRSAV